MVGGRVMRRRRNSAGAERQISAARFQAARLGAGLTQADVADELSRSRGVRVSVTTVARWEAGASFPSGENLAVLMRIYHERGVELQEPRPSDVE
jgi:transcriptional regulator with XRE-family HTH domain